ncbi:uncharacterized protein LOC134255939 [Saccostrea cucullata]|uniref:uncharacterized protein LOC134255939 n=1 Tax=Saccostrea cuccullata TaxID=36930 RepID=UPI002ED25E6D
MEKRGAPRFQVIVFFLTISSSFGFYLITDYYMDPDLSSSLGGVCNKRVEDACAFLNSHLDPFGLVDYGGNIDCTMVFDAGKMAGAKFKFDWLYFNLEGGDCSKDYLAIYDADMSAIAPSNLVGKFCGLNGVSFNGTPTDRYMTFVFHTDGSGAKSGFRLKATRYEPSPCQSEEFFCNDTIANNICIDERLTCDGTQHCSDNSDELNCSFMEELLGSFFALGLGGMIMCGVACIAGCVGLWTVVGALTCCKKCCTKCCCCWPCCKKCKGGNSKVEPNTEMDEYDPEMSPPPTYREGTKLEEDIEWDDVEEDMNKDQDNSAGIGKGANSNLADVE